METIKTFFQSIIESYQDRMKSPVVGSFVLSFVIYNWKMFAILFFADWTIQCKIEWINERYFTDEQILWPLGMAFFYVVLLPYVNIILDFILRTSARMQQQKEDLQREKRHFVEETNAYQKRKIADAEAGTTQINDLKTKNDNLLIEIKELNDKHNLEIKRLNEKESLTNAQYSKLSDELKNLKVNNTIKSDAYDLGMLLRNSQSLQFLLSQELKNAFYSLCENIKNNPTKSPEINLNQLVQLESYGLLNGTLKKIEITPKGWDFYKILKDNTIMYDNDNHLDNG
ncbi:hypothetical protein [Flavobacterium panacagri]|uniref:hypothetical protein n=1 Tax=Flavobacterium panacagri TaxID=3034146 RepID=UPI0025A547F7|nr:hypothetical protein [Flavobacterium panacagri]